METKAQSSSCAEEGALSSLPQLFTQRSCGPRCDTHPPGTRVVTGAAGTTMQASGPGGGAAAGQRRTGVRMHACQPDRRSLRSRDTLA